MEVSVIRIGNSKGIRFSKTMIDRYDIRDKVDLVMEENQIIIRPITKPREGWEETFKEMHANSDDDLIIPAIFEDENTEEWK